MSQSRGARVSIGSIERKLRYRALLEDLVTLDVVEENLETINRTKKVVDETKLLLSDGNVDERVKNPGERHLDSRVLLATSDMVVRCSEAVSGNINTYNRDELAQHIHANPEFWRKFILPKAVPVYSYLYGTFQPTPSEERPKKPRKKIERSQLAALKKPESVDRLEKIEEGPEKVAEVYKFINKYYKSNGQKPINYFHCVLDPNHFGKTVENIYHISFLVRDGFISISMDEESELPFITPVPKDQRERDKSQNKENSQFIVSINIKMWKDAVDAFGIKKSLMQISTKPSTHR